MAVNLPNYTKKKFEELDELKELNVLKLKAKNEIDKIKNDIIDKENKLSELLKAPKEELEKLRIKRLKLSENISTSTVKENKLTSFLKTLEKNQEKAISKFNKANDKLEQERIDEQLIFDNLKIEIKKTKEDKKNEADKLKETVNQRILAEDYNDKLAEEIKEKNKELLAIADNKKHLCKK